MLSLFNIILQSQDSMEHLSAEEKACLMYLEETIEALEVQEDSGLSNDEPDVLSRAEPHNQLRRNGMLCQIFVLFDVCIS